eukprot:6272724-Alexandrium_andersonii.AAC.1
MSAAWGDYARLLCTFRRSPPLAESAPKAHRTARNCRTAAYKTQLHHATFCGFKPPKAAGP